MKNTILVLAFLFTSIASANQNYTFTRELVKGPRGGTTTGPAVEFDKSIPATWTALRESGLTKFERDRRAILGLQGEFEVSFEFLESFLIDTPKNLDTPYFSKATELVKVIEDRGDFISLQHILVMFIVQDGQTMGPFVTKHWRQDWQFNPSERFVYQGSKKWNMTGIESAQGKWSWNVYQVDDSPRYTGLGEWQHLESASIFNTNTMSRPLPRREFSVRGDYKLLMGQETLVLTANSWYHEQKAFKHEGNLINGKFAGKLLAREVGQNSYKRIKNFDWSAGLEYWERTKKYWADVRHVWNELFREQSITLKGSYRGSKLHSIHFKQAEDPEVLKLSPEKRRKLIKETISNFKL
ncbi:MAG: hypothetical protein GY909_05455 [Oligoflexia bacterium]|nr:hypothetical protein [Oligoflexia bacterium]